jgi:hypothetical protein
MPTVIPMKVLSQMIKSTVMGFISVQTGLDLKVNSGTIRNNKAHRTTLAEISTLESLKETKEMGMESTIMVSTIVIIATGDQYDGYW